MAIPSGRVMRASACALLLGSAALAKDAKDEPEHPIATLMRTVPWQIKPELRGRHPRVFVTEEELADLRVRARTTHRELWRDATAHLGALDSEPPPAPAQGRRDQNTVAVRLAEIAFAWSIDKDPRYLAAARKYMDAAVSYDDWGYTFNKPNVDLAAGHLLYALGWAYDLLYDELTPAERERYRAKLVRQGELMYAHFAPKPGERFAYAQNHHFIPLAGLAVAGYALQGEAPEADRWSRLARAHFDRVLATYSPDGYYYEGAEYWIFATPWLIHFLDAHAHATGEDLYAKAPGLASSYLYLAHVLLPGADGVFDLGDAYGGPLSRDADDPDRARTHPGGHYETNYNLLYRLAARFHDPDAQGVAAFLKQRGQVDAEEFWSLVWYDPTLPATPMSRIQPWHHFTDHDVVFWRTGWDDDATALAFKSGPPEGHRAASLLAQFPDWRLSAGHAHPDANSLILYARGQYLTGDSGYAGVPRTDQHDTLLVDGQGQAREGAGHDAWEGYPYDRLDQVRITQARLREDGAFVQGDATTAYDPSLGLRRFVRSVAVLDRDTILMWDDVETERPATLTSLLHADGTARADGDLVEIDRGDASLRVRVLSPDVRIDVEPNEMIGPGKPGSIAAGERQVRGTRAAITNATPSTDVQFVYQASIGTAGKASAR